MLVCAHRENAGSDEFLCCAPNQISVVREIQCICTSASEILFQKNTSTNRKKKKKEDDDDVDEFVEIIIIILLLWWWMVIEMMIFLYFSLFKTPIERFEVYIQYYSNEKRRPCTHTHTQQLCVWTTTHGRFRNSMLIQITVHVRTSVQSSMWATNPWRRSFARPKMKQIGRFLWTHGTSRDIREGWLSTE